MPEDSMTGHPFDGSGNATPTNEANADSTAKTTQALDDSPSNGEIKATDGKQKSEDTNTILEKMRKQLSDKDRFITQQANELASLKNSFAELKGQFTGFTTRDNMDKPEDKLARTEEILDDIPGYFDKVKEDLRKEFQENLSKKEKEFIDKMAMREAHNEMWSNFYESNEHLKPFRKDIVPAVVERIKPSLAGLSQEEALAKIAEASEREIMNLRKRFGSTEATSKGLPKTSHDGKTFEPLPPDPQTYSDLNKTYTEALSELTDRAKGRSSVKTQ